MENKKRILTIIFSILVVFIIVYFLNRSNPYSKFTHIDKDMALMQVQTKELRVETGYYVYYYDKNDQACKEIEELVFELAEDAETTVYFVDMSKNSASNYDWQSHHTLYDIEIGLAEGEKISYYEGESKDKYILSTEINQYGKVVEYEIIIADDSYLEKNTNAKKDYVYASVITPAIDYIRWSYGETFTLAGLPTLLYVGDNGRFENYYYGTDDITELIKKH